MKNIQKSKSAGQDINSSKQARFFSLLHTCENNQNRSFSDDREKKINQFKLQNYFSMLTYRLSSWRGLKVVYLHTHEESMKLHITPSLSTDILLILLIPISCVPFVSHAPQ